MRVAPTLILVAALAAAVTASAQPAQPAQPASGPTAPPPVADKSKSNPEADAALAIAMRMDREREERIARYACIAGDKSKCSAAEAKAPDAQVANAPTTPKTPSP